ncbi:hypothetical protein AB0K05_27035 [Nonomuraea sp. NPDC049486]|uniref:hypothetical protein n=1 Tax=Nonomuraea sp. NPDC049486 TaxID=3155773 RepID=UPI00343443F3
MEGEEQQRHVVVFDVNVYLDVASLLGPPFTWDKASAAAASVAREPVPHRSDLAYDSLRAIAACTSGRFAGLEPLEVWTNAHIDKMVRSKAQQPVLPDPQTGYRGLGWGRNDAQTLVTELIGGLTAQSLGGTLGDTSPDGNPPLDHEDGLVYGACKWLAGDDPLCAVYCVTRDKGFIAAHSNGSLNKHSYVLAPTRFLLLLRAARAQYAIQKTRPGKP